MAGGECSNIIPRDRSYGFPEHCLTQRFRNLFKGLHIQQMITSKTMTSGMSMSIVCFVNTYPLKKDLSGGQRYQSFE